MTARGSQSRSAPPTLTAALLRAWRASVASEEWQAAGAGALTRACIDALPFGLRRRRRQTLLRVLNPPQSAHAHDGAHSVVELVTEDMPFLVDTLTMTLAQAGVNVQLVVHPVLTATRDRAGRLLTLAGSGAGRGSEGDPNDGGSTPTGALRESWQHLRIDRLADAHECAQLQRQLTAAVAEVRRACQDWMPMRNAVLKAAAAIGRHPPPLAADVIAESRALLQYMEAHHFTLLGYVENRLHRSRGRLKLVPVPGSGLGLLRGRDREISEPGTAGVASAAASTTAAAAAATADIRRALRSPDLLIVTKSNVRSSVHRPGFLDYVGVKRYDPSGRVIGEIRILGLWTSSTYSADLRNVPLLRLKYRQALEHFPFAPNGHDAKRLAHILRTLPRDELFQAPIHDLIRTARAVLVLQERARVRLILRRDEFRRFWSCLVYLPRERCDTEARQQVENLLYAALHGVQFDSSLAIGDSPLAQLHMVIRTAADEPIRIVAARLERELAAALVSWRDRLRTALLSGYEHSHAIGLERRYAPGMPASYRQDVDAAAAMHDIDALEGLPRQPEQMCLRLYRPSAQVAARAHLRIVRQGAGLSISEVLPTFEHFGLRVIAERPYELTYPGAEPKSAVCTASIQDFEVEHYDGARIDVERVGEELVAAFRAVRAGELDDDNFNRLLISANLDRRQVTLLRACCRYLLQTGIPFSQSYMERVLGAHAGVARDLWLLFEQRLQPSAPAQAQTRNPRPAHAARRRVTAQHAAARRRAAQLEQRIRRGIEAVRSPDDDRILRAFLAVIRATLRTNYFCSDAAGRPRAWLALKLNPAAIPGLPQPLPAFEIFVHSPRVEGVHLRKGSIARGGIRWSERPEDFRTEILGLMKAQHVKNTLIVPVGAKGGFVVRRLGAGAARAEQQREVVACYQSFIRALLDLTDNIVADRIVPPTQVTRLDGDDPYLVVAADKGTATFSDTANAIAAEYGFWLGDAFASGGSAGYDHKKMGITARGAWECIKRHFRELGKDIQREEFSVAGIGDMSGDVFGNGMLLSRRIRLVAAFNHQHIFVDPEPRSAAAFRERQRLFRLPRSGWNDYDRRMISAGGGVYERSVKSILLSAQAQRLLGLPQRRATPQEIVRAILCLPVELLWNGGIGTYVKASSERHGEIGDRGNDAVRVDGREVRARVIGEGGNLGLSQRGRIEYALHGGRLNADFIDNSAGVNTSDLEVNLKILLDSPDAGRPLRQAVRNRLLAAVTGDVAELVLRNNYLQSQAISLQELNARNDLGEHQQLLRWLERHGELDRALEFLPGDEEIEERRRQGRGLTRPELALLVAYGKIALNHALTSSGIAQDAYLALELQRYFPSRLRTRFATRISQHRLRRQIIITATTNSIVHRMGPGFLMRLGEDTGADAGAIARAYTIARDSADLRQLWSEIEALDGKVRAADQYQALQDTSVYLAHLTHWLVLKRQAYADAGAAVAHLQPMLREFSPLLPGALRGLDRTRYQELRTRHQDAGMPAHTAERLAALPAMRVVLDLAELAATTTAGARAVSGRYFDLAAELGLDWLHGAIETLPGASPWQREARATLQAGSISAHRRIVAATLAPRRRTRPLPALRADAILQQMLARWQQTLRDLRTLDAPDLAALSVAVQSLELLAANQPRALARLL